MAAQAKPITRPTKARTKTQQTILKTKAEHPDLTVREIAAIAECSHVNVVQTLQRYGLNKTHVDNYKNTRADILAGLQEKMLVSLTDDDIKKMPGGSRILAACQLYDKERLERDLSTSNVASVMADVAALRKLDQDK